MKRGWVQCRFWPCMGKMVSGMFCIALCLVAIVDGFPNDAITCPGGRREGEEMEMGTYWYRCTAGQLVPRGCVTPNGRIEMGQTFDLTKSIRWQCTIDAQGFPAMLHKSCMDNGREYQPDQRWENGRVVYECKRDRNYLNVLAVGCVADDGSRRLELGEKVNVGELVYTCKHNRDAISSYRPWGCVGKDGRQYATGDQYEFGDIWYYCMDTDGRITNDQIGCVHNGKRMKDGDRYFENDVIFQCYVNQDHAEFRPSGCVTKHMVNGAKAERRVGCSWQEGDEPFQISFQCKPDNEKKTARKTAEKCHYVLDRGTYKLDIGCYRVIDRVGMACMKNSEDPGDVRFTSWPTDESGQIRDPPPGLRNC